MDNTAKKAMNKTTKIALIITAAVVILFTVLLIIFLTSEDRQNNRDLYSKEEISIRVDGVEVGRLNEQTLREIQTADFQAVLKSSDMLTPVEKTYTGTEIIKVLNYFNISPDGKGSIVTTAGDGLVKAYGIEKVKTDNELFITYIVSGKPFYSGMGYHNDGENGGPYVIIVRSDKFSNNRLKMLVSIDVITKKD